MKPMDPVEAREPYYDTLFRGELPYEPLPEDAEVGIAGLARITHRKGPRLDINGHLAVLPDIVESMLLRHDEAAQTSEPAIFGFVNAKARQAVSDVVADVFAQWEVTYYRHGLDKLLPNSLSPAQGLVLETAAAVMTVNTAIPNINIDKHTGDKKAIAGIIASWGPRFAEQWFNGTIMKQWMDQEGVADEDQAEWTEVFTPGLLKRLATYYIANPLRAFETVKRNLEEVLTDQNIADRLSWSEAEASEVIKPGLRKLLAVSYINDPLKGLEKVKHNLEKILTDANIAESFGLSEAQAASLVPPSMRRRFAVNNIAQPLKACGQWLVGEVPVNPRTDCALVNKLTRMQRG